MVKCYTWLDHSAHNKFPTSWKYADQLTKPLKGLRLQDVQSLLQAEHSRSSVVKLQCTVRDVSVSRQAPYFIFHRYFRNAFER